MSLIDPKVPTEPTAPVVAPATPGAGEGVAPATPAPSVQDAPPTPSTAAADKLQKDINQLKSASQRREAQLQQQAAIREAELKEQLEQTRLNSLDGDARKAYEQELLMNRLKEANDKLALVEQRSAEILQHSNAVTQFRAAGVPESFLNLNGSLDELVQSGWDWILSENKRLNAALVSKGVVIPPALPVAPGVPIPAGGTSPSVKPTWDELEKKYGSKERVYSLVEQRLLPASIIP
jgi:hypothetical protein